MITVGEIDFRVEEKFNSLGVNKKREVVRLLYEIVKRDCSSFDEVLKDLPNETCSFENLKKYLIQKRYPNVCRQNNCEIVDLPALRINPLFKVNVGNFKIQPKYFYIEKHIETFPLVQRIKDKFSDSKFEVIKDYKAHINNKEYTLSNYNQRGDHFFLIKENYDFFKPCPCTPGAVGCGYHVVNLGVGCSFECQYCFLQDYVNAPGITIPANIEDFFDSFKEYKQDVRIGNTEFTDSLIYDHITEYSTLIIDFFRKYPKSTFEFKTKSNNIERLLAVNPSENIVVSWSLNPQSIIDSSEFYSASLNERIEAAYQCFNAGYKVGFHFDPIVNFYNWEIEYGQVVEDIFKRIDAERIAWISLGTLRMMPSLKKIIENRFPENTILDGELIKGYDGKLRYEKSLRLEIYKKMVSLIKEKSKDVYVYLCMEDKTLWKDCGLT